MGTKWVEDLLKLYGNPCNSLTDEEIDAIIASKPDVKIRPEFKERALKAMQEAQRKREQNNADKPQSLS